MTVMDKPTRDFKGIWIPKEIWLSEQLSLMEKVLFVEISSLDNEHGCFASNKYFSDFFGIHARRICAHIASLKHKGFITMTIENQSERVIRVAGKYARVSDSEFRRMKLEQAKVVHNMRIRSKEGMP